MLRELHSELGIPDDYGLDGTRPVFAEAADLVDVGVILMIVSGFRSIDYQARLIRKKLNAGQSVSEILSVNAAPGFSEHHTGRAVDIASPGSRPLTEEFEDSDAFRWLERNAAGYGFSMSYPRDNPGGFIYEPWHWAQKP